LTAIDHCSSYEIGRAPRASCEEVDHFDGDDVMEIEPDMPSGVSQVSACPGFGTNTAYINMTPVTPIYKPSNMVFIIVELV